MPREVEITAGYERTRLADPKAFDPRSFRTKTLARGRKLIVGCPKGEWMPRRQRCRVGTRAQALLRPRMRPNVAPSVFVDLALYNMQQARAEMLSALSMIPGALRGRAEAILALLDESLDHAQALADDLIARRL